MSNKVFLLLFVFVICGYMLQAKNRWQIQTDGSIGWIIDEDIPHYDHIEMSGEQISVVFRYGVNADGSFKMERSIIWPMLRTIPNNTHGSLMHRFSIDFPSSLIVNGMSLNNEKVKSITLDGFLTVISEFSIENHNIAKADNNTFQPVVELTRMYYPSTKKPILCESYKLKNISKKPLSVMIPEQKSIYKTDKDKGVDGSYYLSASLMNNGLYHIEAGEEIAFGAYISANRTNENKIAPDIAKEKTERKEFVFEVWDKLDFECPDQIISRMFAFAKIRASESIYRTKGGLMHGPGGESYYAAIWANDQAEYANPFFPFLGYKTANESAFNSFTHFARFMNPSYIPIPSSIVAEGLDIWNGAGDRGDAAMIAYGATRYALSRADKKEASELWPLIEWCLEFCKKKLNDKGVVVSDNDELEGRFPAGDANLCTSSLYYDALISASYLSRELGLPTEIAKRYKKEAEILKNAINSHFAASVESFETYRYYDGNDILRSWIAIPLTVNIFDKKNGTVEALLSPLLWTKDGLLTQSGTNTFWDRSTLYALRGIYQAGEREKATHHLSYYSGQRLLGEHVPYAIEAWPEGNQRHLSAESALYCRIITEGLFGIRPAGFSTFDITPQLPEEWNMMSLKNIGAFGNDPFDILVEKDDTKIKTTILRKGKIVKTWKSESGKTLKVKLT